MKKNKIILLAALCFLLLSVSSVSATSVLYDWNLSTWNQYNYGVPSLELSFYQAPDIYLPPEVGGEITAVSGFGMFTPSDDPYGYDVPNAVGSIEFTFNPGMAGLYTVDSFFDVEIDEWGDHFYNESGALIGTPISSPSSNQFGYYLDDFGDIAVVMGWDMNLVTDESYAIISYFLSDNAPESDFYITHTDDDTGETLYFSSTIEIVNASVPVPEPSPIMLLSCGFIGLFTLRSMITKKNTENT